MRIYGKRSGRNNIPRLIARSYKYYSKQQSNTKTGTSSVAKYTNSNLKDSMDTEAILKTKNVEDKYRLYDKLVEFEIDQEQFSFDLLMKRYIEEKFEYKLSYPEKNSPELLKVPKESWLDRIFKSRKRHRLEIIEKNNAIIEEANQKYIDAVNTYEQNMKLAYSEWLKQENEKKRIIDEYNKKIENWKWRYYCGDVEAVKAWIQCIINSIKPVGDVKFIIQSKFNEDNGELYLKIVINSLYEIFASSEYKYFPRKRELRPIEMKVRERIAHSRNLIENILYSFLYKFYYNDIGNIINKITIDVMSDELIVGSCWCSKKDGKYAKNQEKIIIDSCQIRICKNIQKEVESFAEK